MHLRSAFPGRNSSLQVEKAPDHTAVAPSFGGLAAATPAPAAAPAQSGVMSTSPLSSSIADLRKSYERAELNEDASHPAPLQQFDQWLQEAIKAQVPEPTRRS